MKLSNNQLGRLQLTLALLARVRSAMDRGHDYTEAQLADMLREAVDAWWPRYSEIDQLASDFKELYNYSQPFELKEVET